MKTSSLSPSQELTPEKYGFTLKRKHASLAIAIAIDLHLDFSLLIKCPVCDMRNHEDPSSADAVLGGSIARPIESVNTTAPNISRSPPSQAPRPGNGMCALRS